MLIIWRFWLNYELKFKMIWISMITAGRLLAYLGAKERLRRAAESYQAIGVTIILRAPRDDSGTLTC